MVRSGSGVEWSGLDSESGIDWGCAGVEAHNRWAPHSRPWHVLIAHGDPPLPSAVRQVAQVPGL